MSASESIRDVLADAHYPLDITAIVERVEFNEHRTVSKRRFQNILSEMAGAGEVKRVKRGKYVRAI